MTVPEGAVIFFHILIITLQNGNVAKKAVT